MKPEPVLKLSKPRIERLPGDYLLNTIQLTQDLHFNVPRLLNEFLHKQGSIAKGGQGFRVGPLVVFFQLLHKHTRHSGTE